MTFIKIEHASNYGHFWTKVEILVPSFAETQRILAPDPLYQQL